MLAQKRSPPQIIEELYLRCLSRKPTVKEMATLTQAVGEAGKEQEGALNDVFWALLNSKEFIFNH